MKRKTSVARLKAGAGGPNHAQQGRDIAERRETLAPSLRGFCGVRRAGLMNGDALEKKMPTPFGE